MPALTAEEFEQQYAQRSGITVEFLRVELGRVVVPCNCDYEGCLGWQSISRALAVEDGLIAPDEEAI